jgi:hypothetical protein
MVLINQSSQNKRKSAERVVMDDSGPFKSSGLSILLETHVSESSSLGMTVTEVDTSPRILDIHHVVSFEILPIIAAVAVAIVIVSSEVESD